jgi:hypothetical protein
MRLLFVTILRHSKLSLPNPHRNPFRDIHNRKDVNILEIKKAIKKYKGLKRLKIEIIAMMKFEVSV